MQAKVQNMSHSFGYIKCGEIFQSQQSFGNPYILRCMACQQMYLLLESFILHFKDECKIARSTEMVFHNAKILKEDAIKNPSVILESYNMEDPLISVSRSLPKYLTQDDEVITAKTQNENKQQDTASNETHDDSLNVLKSEIIFDDEVSPTKQYSNLSENNIKIKTNLINSLENLEDSTSEDIVAGDNESDEQQLVQQSYPRHFTYKFNIQKFMDSKTNVSILIAAYKNQPSLWNKYFPSLRHKEKRQEYLQKIANELKDQANIVITWNQIATIIVHICQKYREYLNRLKSNAECKEESNKYIPLWYFKELYFLKPFIENNLIAKLGLYLPELLPHEIIQILNIYKGFSYLWNTESVEYYCKNKRSEAIKEMLQALETTMNLKISEDILEEYLQTVHNCFYRAKKKRNTKEHEQVDIDEKVTHEDYYEYMMFLFDHVAPFKCSECGSESKSALMYKIHKSQHNGSAPLTCSVCKREFTSSSTYINHAKHHMEDTKFECKECGKKFYISTELDIHMRNHTGVKPFTCEICGTSFRHIQSLSTHQRRHEKKYLHTCHICSKGFYTMDSFKDHMNRHTNTRTHVCNVCNKTFINKKGLRIHEVIHEDIRKHECKICHKTFKHRSGVNQHMKTHKIAKTNAT